MVLTIVFENLPDMVAMLFISDCHTIIVKKTQKIF